MQEKRRQKRKGREGGTPIPSAATEASFPRTGLPEVPTPISAQHLRGRDHQLVNIPGGSPAPAVRLSQGEVHFSTTPCPVPLQLCCVASPYPFLHARWCVLCMCPVRNRSPICLGQKVEYSLLFLKFKLECATSLATVPLFLVLPWDTHRCRIPCHGHSLILPACRLLFTRTVAVRYSLTPGLRLHFSPRHLSVRSFFQFPLVLLLKLSF